MTTPRRLRPLVAALFLGAGAAAAWAAGNWGAGWIERQSATAVRTALAQGGFAWVRVSADGLTLRLAGTAPDEIAHVRALAAAAAHVAAARIDDRVTVAPPPEATPPAFRLDILRNGEGEGPSVVGLVPAGQDRAALVRRLTAGAANPTDLVETTDAPAPAGWDAAVDFALDATELAPRAKISATPGRVEVTAVTDGESDKARLETALREALPEGVELVTAISAPRPVIAPFALRLARSGHGAALDPCAADSEAARDRILAAAGAAGASQADCPIGLGAPSPQWADAAVAGIEALAALSAGTLSLTDTVVRLDVPDNVPEQDFTAARDRLAAALPKGFALTATLAESDAPAPDGPVSFDATATAQGVQLRGAVSDDRMRAALESLARARFGQVDSALTVNPDMPAGWTLRVIGALQAMAELQRGSAVVTADRLRISGTTGSRTAAQSLGAVLGERLGAGVSYELALTYDPRLDPALDLPTGQECVDRLNATVGRSEILFEPNRAEMQEGTAEIMNELARAMRGCNDFRIELGAHTDSQGSDQFNMELSQDRAEAVRKAMADSGIDVARLVAKGHGETRPVADNDTDIGREANRRIEFRLLSPYPAAARPAAADVTRAVTVAQPDPAASPAPQNSAAPHPAPAAQATIAPRLDGVPPQLSGGQSAAPAPAPVATAPTAPAPGGADAAPTPDEAAVAEGIILRPREITVEGSRVTTPVPPPWGASATATVPEPGAAQRPPPRPRP